MHALDHIDRKILNLLQDDATLPLKVIAEKVGTSTATTQRRISQLNDAKVIERTVVIVNPIKVQRPLTVLVLIKMVNSNTPMQHRFERVMAAHPQVMSCYEISGDYDFVLIVANQDMQDYHRFTRQMLTSDNNVATFNSQFVMNSVKSSTKIFLDDE
ncbi:Lrp/AsnC family transcriptional regulator [Moraxella sp. FZLJ2107]|uniref:Lrp/AsnC family transcriptional regulator n=1 Tax=unclassified Moraxella TaxID=2685852 RepID=UPI00209BE2ED|nr:MULTISPECIES: Lrp/AsnC family transcriptional regulator [unclassified Moraxella]USZ15703.1 Lrp/AsnC family transcriptional regulator [Moraxella sp. FZFQ2102]UTO04502.1 Lrp/AsnC family transcriptional regulator [Moraxella sp. FZLJ2107]UTO23335.1 Lrp/AsnC family transcriptional regulator [Moraxella sp. FZLJ2109]